MTSQTHSPEEHQTQAALRELRGVVERITFQDAETGFTVARLAPERAAGMVSDIVRHDRDSIDSMAASPHIERLGWDDWNRDHIAKHAVLPEEAEEVVAGEPTVRETYKQRLQLVGPTFAGRMLSIVVGPVPDQTGVYYVFSARTASRKERGAYAQEKGGARP